MWGDGKGFVPDEYHEGAIVQVVAQNPGEMEEKGERVTAKRGRGDYDTEPCPPAPLIGPTGWEVTTKYLPESGLTRDQVNWTNVLKCRMIVGGRRVNDMPKGKMWQQVVAHCTAAHFRVPPGVKLLVAMGGHAWRALRGPGSITEWRGFLSPIKYE